ncbi:hypothetical protein [Campylobacter vicugnae]|nr:hypothetical protein [Campylobacter sp. RM8964]
MEQIFLNLKEWRRERNISSQMQRDNFITLIQEELREYYEAKNVEEQIDALSDMAVVAINCSKSSAPIFFPGGYKDIVTNDKVSFGVAIDKIKELDFDDSEIMKFLILIANKIEELGYDFILCLHETVKEISSRTGHWDKEKGKWIKNTSEEAKKMWYKANYKKCRIIEKGWDEYTTITRYKGEI